MIIKRYKTKVCRVKLDNESYQLLSNNTPIQIKTLIKIKCKGGMRDCFTPPEGYVWVSEDYSSEEVVVMANLSNESGLIDPLLQGQDIHKYVATKMFGHYDPTHRTIAKTITFAANYGASGYTIGKRLGVSQAEGEALLDKYNKALPNLTKWKTEMIKEGRRKGIVFTYFGRPRPVWMYYQSSDSSKHSYGDRTCVNTVVQGAGADIIRIDHVKLYGLYNPKSPTYNKEFAENTKYANTIHDEINIFSKPEYLSKAVEVLRSCMEMSFSNWKVSLKVSPSVGVDWGHQIEIKGFDSQGKIIPDVEEDLTKLA